MLGFLVALGLSWLLLWFFGREPITRLGIRPTGRRLAEFGMGTLVMGVLCAITFLAQAHFTRITHGLNPDYDLWGAIEAIGWTLRATLFEELLFRGALLYLLIRKLGTTRACLASAVAFGIYHWFSYEMLGGPIIALVYVFLLTGAAGFMFALAFAKTKSLYASTGLHFGWIVVSIVVFSSGPLGNQLLLPQGEAAPLDGWLTLVNFLWQAVAVPGMVILALRKWWPPIEEEPPVAGQSD
ncbi:MAG: CPBP family intramembrane glutamic endopeptidase [Myxococcota bacterium]